MSLKSTYLEQDLVNIIASMTFNLPGYPRHFYETGYKIEFIEKEFDVTQDGKVRELKFDIVLNNYEKNHSLACECKSGGTESDQLRRYKKLKSEELVRVGGVSSGDPSLHTHDITIVFNDVNKDKISKETKGYNFKGLSVAKDSSNPTLIELKMGSFQDDDLDAYFTEPISYPAFVHEVFKVGGQTPVFKYVKLIAAELVSISVDGKEHFEISDLAPGIASSVPGLYNPARIGKQMRKDIENKIEKALIEGSSYELNEYFTWDKSLRAGKLLKIKPGCKPLHFKQFKEQADNMAERMRKGEASPATFKRNKSEAHPDQTALDLFPKSV
ncbi:hypothetical protein [Rossellomorea aquimaris]|uniref:Uncharacterized protein n=1 Tax=Rossellomorea aquimaris TaxID=189382 RepID=A0A5D4TPM1_9BACI|nr:hypothetical protein [Rossellomorea aquimaris]TYS76761.1 hypothetical protein FZD05_16265 [Rossellomorea aquimaris]TYS83666.1 hypothetical protein FZC85_16870 [Rossellomorea aquimaris]